MKKQLLTVLVLLSAVCIVNAQTYKTKDGHVYFNPNKNQENRQYAALSKEATAMFNSDSATVALFMPMKTFHFNNTMLENHFNEDYLHTDKFPDASYEGRLIGFEKSMLQNDGEYKLRSEGIMVLHGVTRNFKAPLTMTVRNHVATFRCAFLIKAVDVKIKVPGVAKPKLLEATPLYATIPFKLD